MEVKYINHCGDDLSVVNAARVSFDKESLEFSNKDEKLINYLAKHEHFSPFNHTFITMRVKAPIFVARQLVKHEYMPWNEISRRYVDDDPEFCTMIWRARPEASIKQGSGEEMILPQGVENSFIEALRAALRAYDDLLGAGVAPELARAVLPQNTYTEWYWSGTLKAWSKMYNLRTHEGAQIEAQEIAIQCGEILETLFPVSWKALTNV
jgi:thymidylate synthase (FAD)